jgi:glycosyltransferase involved in cell wall biosynthesis
MIDTSFKPGRARRVLHLVGRMQPGGAENWLMKLLRKADPNVLKMDFCVATPQKGLYEEEIESLGIKIIRITIKPFLTYQHRLARVLRENQCDVVHSHLWLFSGIILKVANRCNVPIRIAYCHTTRDEYRASLYRKLYTRFMRYLITKHSTHCLACCSEAASALLGPKWNSTDKCHVLYTSIDVEEFRPGQSPAVTKGDFGIPSDAVVIGHVGSFRLAKNHSFLLDIAAEIIKRRPDAYFFLAGDGRLRDEAEAKATRLGMSDKVIFAGNRHDVPQLMMNLFDVLLFPSVYEGMPLTLVEAAAAGLRVVCSDVITNEATDVLSEAFTRLSLDLGPEQWAEAVTSGIKKGGIPHNYAYDCVRRSHFSDEFSLRELMRVYGCV